jgi:hypothetical protein
MARMTPAQRREYNAQQRQLRKYRARLQQEQTRAQRFLQGLEQALVAWGLPEPLTGAVAWQLQAPATLLGKIVGLMFPPVFGCRTSEELTPLRVWDKNLPSRLLGALPKQTWVRPLPHRGQALLATRWRQAEDRAPRPAVAGHGPGWRMTASSRRMASRWGWSGPGRAARHPEAGPGSMACSWGW